MYILSQLNDIRKGRSRVLFRKIGRAIDYLLALLFFPLILLLLFFIRGIRKWKHVRFGYFVSYRIGHFAADAGILFAEAKKNKTYLDFYFIPKPVSNMQWYKMICRNFNVTKVAEAFYRIDRMVFNDSMHRIIAPMERLGSRDKNGILNSIHDTIPFLEEEDLFCKRWLLDKGWQNDQKFVCLMIRDSTYLQKHIPDKDFSYHNYRDSEIDTYLDSVKTLTEMGYWVIRMGKVAKKKLTYNHERFIDYPFLKDQNDLLDIWLMANCYFVISTGTGLDAIADIYRRPVVYLNLLPLSNIVSWSYAITVPKYLKWKETGKYLSFLEHLNNNYCHSEKYKDSKIRIEDLSSEDISEAVLELESRLRGKWIETDEDKELQERFWKLLKGWENFSQLHGWTHPKAKVGSSFLMKMGKDFFKV
ncbi:TIGR04372 family glycosyltransferase [Leptospira interrogans]|uniref:TIGR04372 family glycosyltransferase n=1 Tax=Leptospira interrogans TaxID=173 RepID=UPI0007741C24|nr:TIGR04372 family glycosyltransferase [Leptospira interrogans]